MTDIRDFIEYVVTPPGGGECRTTDFVEAVRLFGVCGIGSTLRKCLRAVDAPVAVASAGGMTPASTRPGG